jgi:hypothetical protein
MRRYEMIREQSDKIGHNIHASLVKLGIGRRYFGEFPYPDHFERPVLEECLSFVTKEERDRIYRAFSEALHGWVGEFSLVCADDFGSKPAGDYRFDLTLSVRARVGVPTTARAYEIMVQATDQIYSKICDPDAS